MKKSFLTITAAAILLLSFFACDKNEDYITDSSAKLAFSLDTLRFDTVFTELGSSTRSFKIYNRHDQPILISEARIVGATGINFRMNVDGLPGDELQDVEIWANDSIYVFVEVTIDPNQPLSVSPFVLEDKIEFVTNGNLQQVHLEAWGQNANYFPSRFNKGVPVLLSCDNGTIRWDDPKPYVIYGEILIDSCALEVAAGTRIYVHGGIARNDVFGVFNDGILYALSKGKIRMLGTAENPIVVQGDRLEEAFQDEVGQWYGIILGKGSKGNVFEYTTIKNCSFGLYADSTAEVRLSNSQIYNTAGNGLIGFHSTIEADNCLFYNNNSNSIQLLNGGDYRFIYCTATSYGVDAAAVGMSNFYCYDDPLVCAYRNDFRLNAAFSNCIFFGSRRDQIQFSDITGRQTPAMFNVAFENCVVRVDDLLEQQNDLYADFFDNICLNCINGVREDKLFIDANEDDYHLDSLSIAIGRALPVRPPKFNKTIEIDLENKTRDSEMPDIGCFERQ
ncbi:MAG: right-handed parallel beta-helix repeat-containing protein [Saprospiraceae bacterium]